MARRDRKREANELADPDLTPIMNIAFMLILAMLTLSSALPLGLISVEAPQINDDAAGAGSKPDDPPAQELNLTIFLTKTGISIGASGATLDGSKDKPARPGEPLFPLINKAGKKAQDFTALRKKLTKIKRGFPDEDSILIIADEDIIYDDIINTMDAAREDDDGEVLFPGVAFSAGIVG